MKKTLIVDIDDVLWDLMNPWCEFYYNHTGVNINIQDITTWDISNLNLGINIEYFYSVLSTNQFWDFVVNSQEEETLSNNFNYLYELNKYFNLYIATATSHKHSYKIELFLDIFYFLTENQIILIKDKWMLDGDIFIDDNLQTLLNCSDKNKEVIRIKKPWNRSLIRGYDSFQDAANILLRTVSTEEVFELGKFSS